MVAVLDPAGLARPRLDSSSARSARTAVERGELLDDLGKLRTTGTLYVTDSRAVLMGNRRRQLSCWSWNELASVSLIRGFAGVRFVRADDDASSDAALHVYRKLVVVDASALDVALQLVQVEAAYVLVTGRDYEARLAGRPTRWV